jgi:hypothetical protein
VQLLGVGLIEWGGVAYCTNEFAVAMGFDSAQSMPIACRRIRKELIECGSLESNDWIRSLLATEVAFVSDVVGSGYEWSTTTGWLDEETVLTLRTVQRKLAKIIGPLVGTSFGTRPPKKR